MRRRWVLACVLVSAPALAQTQAPPAPIMVMPFAPKAGQPKTYWLGEGVSVLLTNKLQRRGFAVVTREERLRTFERLQLPQSADLSRATVIRAGQVVGAGYIVTGAIDGAGEELSITARVIRLDSGRILPEVVERGPLSAVYETVDRVADRLERSNPLPRAGQPSLVDRAGSGPAGQPAPRPPLAAFEQYVKGLLADAPAAQTAFLKAAIERFSGYDEARLALWRVLTAQGDHAEAAKYVQAIASSSPHARTARFLAALAEMSLQHYDEAFAGLKELHDATPSAPVMNNLGVIQLRRTAGPETGRASYYFTKASELAPEDADYFFNLGYAYLKERDTQAAIYWLREAVRRRPLDGEAHFLLAIALTLANATAEAAREQELAARVALDYESLEKARAAAAGGVPAGLERVKDDLDSDRATVLEASLFKTEHQEQEKLAAFYLDRGRRHFEAERDREAIADLKRSLFLSPYLPEPHLLLARLYVRGGRDREAIDELQMAVWSSAPESAERKEAEALLQRLKGM